MADCRKVVCSNVWLFMLMILMFLLTKFHNSIFQIRFSVVTCLCLWHNIWNKWYYQVNGSHNTNGCHLQFSNTCVNETNKSRNFITFSIIFRDKWHDLNIGNDDICWFEHKPYLRSELWSLVQLNTLDQQPLTVSASWVASSSEMEQELLEIFWWWHQPNYDWDHIVAASAPDKTITSLSKRIVIK